MDFIVPIVAMAIAVFLFVALRRALHTYLKLRGERIVSCPETHKPAAVRVAAGKAALESTVGDEELRLSACSRWPKKEAGDQEFLSQFQKPPKACLVGTIIIRW